MSTPARASKPSTPAKTPGWGAMLFPFSTAKKERPQPSPQEREIDPIATQDRPRRKPASSTPHPSAINGGRNGRHPGRIDFGAATAPSPHQITSPLAGGTSVRFGSGGSNRSNRSSQGASFDLSATMNPGPSPAPQGWRKRENSAVAFSDDTMGGDNDRSNATGLGPNKRAKQSNDSFRSPWKSQARNPMQFSLGAKQRSSQRGARPRQTRSTLQGSGVAKLKSRHSKYRANCMFLQRGARAVDTPLNVSKALQALQQTGPLLSRKVQRTNQTKQQMTALRLRTGDRILGSNQTGGSRLPPALPPSQHHNQHQQQQQSRLTHNNATAASSSTMISSSSVPVATDINGEAKRKSAAGVSRQQQRQPSARSSANGGGVRMAPSVGFATRRNETIMAVDKTPKTRHLPATGTPYRPAGADSTSITSPRTIGSHSSPYNSSAYSQKSGQKFAPLPPVEKRILLSDDAVDAPQEMGELETLFNIRKGIFPPNPIRLVRRAQQAESTTHTFDENEYEQIVSESRRKAESNKSSEPTYKTAEFGFARADQGGTQAPKRTRRKDSPAPTMWKCTKETDGVPCNTMNPDDESRCVKCKSGRPKPKAPQGWGNLFADMYAGKWRCDACGVHNDDNLDKCASCETPRATGESPSKASGKKAGGGASKPSQKPAAAAPGSIGSGGFSFGGASSSTSKAAFSFGRPPAAASSSSSPAPAKTGGFTFGGAATAPSSKSPTTQPADSSFQFSFGSSSSKTEAQSIAGFTFSAARKTDNGDKAKPTPAIQFGSSAPSAKSPAVATETTKPAFTFGATKPAGGNAATPKDSPAKISGFNFGGTAASSDAAIPKDSSAKTSGFSFGGTAASSDAAKKTPAIQFGGGTKTPPVPAPTEGLATQKSKRSRDDSGGANGGSSSATSAPATGFSFGSAIQKPATDDKAQAKTSAPTFSFGSAPSSSQISAPAPAPTPTPKFSFGASGDKASTTTPSSSSSSRVVPAAKIAFGSVASADSGASGQDASDNSKRRKSGAGMAALGAAASSAQTSMAPVAPVPASTPGFSFGGSLPAPPAPAPATTNGTPAFSFGSAAPPAAAPGTGMFGAPTPAPSTDGASKPAFSFGSTPAPAPVAPAGSGFSFGSAPTPAAPAAPAFGSSTSSGSMFGAPAPAPAFGSAATPAANPTSMFGSAPAVTPAATGTPAFTFGASTPAPPATTPGAFGASASAAGTPFGGQTPMPSTPGFGGGFGAPAAPTPGTTSGFGGGFGAPAAPAAGGFGQPAPGGGFGAAPAGGTSFGTPAAPPANGGAMFSVGSGVRTRRTPASGGRRVIRAKRPGRTG